MITGIIMASGLSRRMGINKLLLEVNGKRIIDYVIENALRSKLDEIVIVYSDRRILENILDFKIKMIFNRHNELGQSESIKLGLKNSSSSAEGYCFLPGDMPLLDFKTIDNILDSFNMYKMKSEKSILIPRYNGINSSPVVFSSNFKNELLELSGDEGGKVVIESNLKFVKYIDFKNEILGKDVDTRSDFRFLEVYFEKNKKKEV